MLGQFNEEKKLFSHPMKIFGFGFDKKSFGRALVGFCSKGKQDQNCLKTDFQYQWMVWMVMIMSMIMMINKTNASGRLGGQDV